VIVLGAVLLGGLVLIAVAGVILFVVLPRDSTLGRLLPGSPDTSKVAQADERPPTPPEPKQAHHPLVVPIEKPPADPPISRDVELKPTPSAPSQPVVREPTPEVKPALPKEEPTPKEPAKPSTPVPTRPEKVTVKRLQKLDDEELRKQLLLAPEVALDALPGSATGLVGIAKQLEANGLIYPGPVLLNSQRLDLAGLPMRMGLDCRLGKEPADNLLAQSRLLRGHLEKSIPKSNGDQRPDPDVLRRELLAKSNSEWLKPEAIPALLQLLQAENKPIRLVLVELLSKIDHKRATEALAMRALVDLSAEVREAALQALLNRPAGDYRDLLLAGLRYPWRALQEHAAEALVALGHKDAVPQLVHMLEETPVEIPFATRINKKEVMLVREVVRVNHLANCVLCHAPSFDRGDPVRGAVPTPGQPLPAPVTTPQYYERGGSFVRADITYLRQDFSVMQSVLVPNKWPANQRYDYMTRLRPLSKAELKQYEQVKKDLPLARLREPLLFALRELTGKDLGSEPDKWLALLKPEEKPKPAELPAALSTAPGDWKQFLLVRGAPEDTAAQQREASRLAGELSRASEKEREQLLAKMGDRGDPVHVRALAEAMPQLNGEARDKVREALTEQMRRASATALREYLQDDSAEVRHAAAVAIGKGKAKVHIPDLIPLLEDADRAVAEAALASLKALTGEDFGPTARAWGDWWKKKLGS
jgi:HEAT repeat protein